MLLMWNLRGSMEDFPGFLLLKITRECFYCDKQVLHMSIPEQGLGQEASTGLCFN